MHPDKMGIEKFASIWLDDKNGSTYTLYMYRYVEPLLKFFSCLNIAISFPIGQPEAARGEVEADNAAVLMRDATEQVPVSGCKSTTVVPTP